MKTCGDGMGMGMTTAGMGWGRGQNLKCYGDGVGMGTSSTGTDGDGDMNVSPCSSLLSVSTVHGSKFLWLLGLCATCDLGPYPAIPA